MCVGWWLGGLFPRPSFPRSASAATALRKEPLRPQLRQGAAPMHARLRPPALPRAAARRAGQRCGAHTTGWGVVRWGPHLLSPPSHASVTSLLTGS